jgi:uncharacterized OB-fold protein
MMSYMKPLPALDPESRPFWEGCRVHKFLVMKCRSCGKARFPATTFCPHCRSSELDWVEIKGTGKVFSWIVVRHPVPRDVYAGDVPYIVALVDLPEGVRVTTNIVDCSPEDVRADMQVRVKFRDVTPEISLPVFAPV